MKYTTLLIATLHLVFAASGQSKFAYDTLSKSVSYKQVFKLNPKLKADEAFTLCQSWFNAPAKFTRKNADPPADSVKMKKNKNKLSVDQEFDNSKPLQMLNPAGNKLMGLGLIKYYGTGSSIRLLYLKYDITVETKQGLALISISNIRYFHFNPNSYALAGLYSFGGGKPCENEGSIEALIDCENFHDEFKNLALYFNTEANYLFTDFKTLLKQKKALFEAKTASASATTKTPVKKK